MKSTISSNSKEELTLLCNMVRELLQHNEYKKCELIIADAMGKHPHAPEPHNLFGALLEKRGKHSEAMKHFRAAWALDPTYIPARCNLDNYGTFFFKGQYAIDETDCKIIYKSDDMQLEYDEFGVGHVIRRKKDEPISKTNEK